MSRDTHKSYFFPSHSPALVSPFRGMAETFLLSMFLALHNIAYREYRVPVFDEIFLLFSSQDNVDQTSAHGRRDLVEPGFQEPSNRISLNHQGKK